MPNPSKPESDWIVRIERRRDGKRYFFRHDGNTTARYESSMRLPKEIALQLANAIATQHKDFTARACRFDSPVHRRKSKCKTARLQRNAATIADPTEPARENQTKSASSRTGTDSRAQDQMKAK